MREENFYRPLEKYLDTINSECIAMEESDTKLSVQITLTILDKIISRLKETDDFFKATYNRNTYVGSYFDGLRVKEATEFDVNCVLSLPVDYSKIVVSRDPRHPGYVKINLLNSAYTGAKLQRFQSETVKLFKMVDPYGFLSHEAVLRWWESMFSRIHLNELDVDGRKFKITFHKAGPAMTASIHSRSQQIDVDIVPVIEFTPRFAPPQPIRWKNLEFSSWFAVPKRLAHDPSLWRISFPGQEQQIMNGKFYLKMTNRFLKRFRDANNWKDLTSYYIKTMFIWEAYEQEFDYHFRKNRGYLLVYFLNKLSDYLDRGHLPFFWDDRMNLLEKIKYDSLLNYSFRIKRLVSKLERLIEEDRPSELNELMIEAFYPPDERRSRLSMPVLPDSSSDSSGDHNWELVEPAGDAGLVRSSPRQQTEENPWSTFAVLAGVGAVAMAGAFMFASFASKKK